MRQALLALPVRQDQPELLERQVLLDLLEQQAQLERKALQEPLVQQELLVLRVILD